MTNEFDIELNKDEFRKDIKDAVNSPLAKEIARDEGVYLGGEKWHNFLFTFFIISLIVGLTAGIILFGKFVGLVEDGAFQSNQKVDLEPNITINNEYAPTTNNEYNHKIENNSTIIVNNFVECPTT